MSTQMLKLALTFADITGSDHIQASHLAEMLQQRLRLTETS